MTKKLNFSLKPLLATGLATLSTISTDMRAILLEIHAEYRKKARGELTAQAEFELPPSLSDNTPCRVQAELKDRDGDVVCVVQATWLIGYQKR